MGAISTLRCTGPRNLKKIKQDNANKYSHLTPEKAPEQMNDGKVPLDERPETWRLQNQRPTKEEQAKAPFHIEAVCLGALKYFVTGPHPDIAHIFGEHVVCRLGKVRASPLRHPVPWQQPANQT